MTKMRFGDKIFVARPPGNPPKKNSPDLFAPITLAP